MTVVVEEINVSEFRGIRRMAKPLKLRKLNVLIGRNGVGKTAVLEALYLLSRPYKNILDMVYGKTVIDYIASIRGKDPASLVYGYAGVAKLSFKLERRRSI